MPLSGLAGLFNLAPLRYGLEPPVTFRTNIGLSLSCFLQGL